MVTVVDSVTVTIGMIEIMAKTVTITVFAIASSSVDIDINVNRGLLASGFKIDVNICFSSIVMVRCPCVWVFAIVWSEACWNSVRHLLSEEDFREGETEGVSEFV